MSLKPFGSSKAPLPTNEIAMKAKQGNSYYTNPKTKVEVLFKYYEGNIQDINDLSENLCVKERREIMLYSQFWELEAFKVFSRRSFVFTRFIARISTKVAENDIRQYIFRQ
jgi:hypothetical protein